MIYANFKLARSSRTPKFTQTGKAKEPLAGTDRNWRKFNTRDCAFDNTAAHARVFKDSIRKIINYVGCGNCNTVSFVLEDGTVYKFANLTDSTYQYMSKSFVNHLDYDKASGRFVEPKKIYR